jgi:HD superfamily phosphohydrolase
MFPSLKTTLIADNFHYPIPISDLEKRIISTQVFNRLHNILQNSTVYFTYPSNRTTRFIHSLGCMHIAGQIFQHSINNAKSAIKIRFFDSVKKEIENIHDTDVSFQDKIGKFIATKSQANMNSLDSLGDKLYLSALPGALRTGDQYAFIIVYQALRIAALLHDLGHPPFSHVTEQALEELKIKIFIKRNNSQALSDSEEKYWRIVNAYPGRFHEELGEILARRLLDTLEPKCDLNDRQDYKAYSYNTLIIFKLSRNILHGKRVDKDNTNDLEATRLYESLHQIISYDLDADRLDYVSRDMFNSGLLSYPINYGRLISSFQLMYEEWESNAENGSKSGTPMFLPSVRALSTIEDFYRQRFDLYKYVIYHHRVTKSDGLLKVSIINLANEYFANNKVTDTSQIHQNAVSYLLPQDISGLWEVMDPPEMKFRDDIIYHYLQWDDAWLLEVLRKKFLELNHNIEQLNPREKLLRIQLEEILSNQKHYHSLYKRMDTFIPIDKAFLELVPSDFDWTIFEEKILRYLLQHSDGTITECPGPIRDQIDTIARYASEYKEAKSKIQIENLRESNGFFLTNIVLLLRLAAQSCGVIAYSEGMDFAINALNDLIEDFKLTDAIIMPRHIKPGVKSDLKLVIEGERDQVINLGAISRIADDLKRSSKLFPPFFIYTYKETESGTLDIEKMRSKFGKHLFSAFMVWFEQFPERS